MTAPLPEEKVAALAEALAPDLYVALMEVTADSWRQWRYLTTEARERHRKEATEMVAHTLAPLVAGWLGEERERATFNDEVRREQIRMARAEALREAAVVVERNRRENPMNGDGSNATLDRVLAGLDALAGDQQPSDAAWAERERMTAERELHYFRLEAINARARGDQERERRALDEIARRDRTDHKENR